MLLAVASGRGVWLGSEVGQQVPEQDGDGGVAGEMSLSHGGTQLAKPGSLHRRDMATSLLCVVAGHLQVCTALPSLRAFEGKY